MAEQMSSNKKKMKEYEISLKRQKQYEEERSKAREQMKIAEFLTQQGAIEEAKVVLEETACPSKRLKAEDGGYWTQTPEVDSSKSKIERPDTKVCCKAESNTVHHISLKQLQSITFVLSEDDEHICPVCLKTLKNGILLTSCMPCGHVLCNDCYSTVLTADGNNLCSKCETVIESSIDLAKEGTGFAAGGNVLVTKEDVAFQC